MNIQQPSDHGFSQERLPPPVDLEQAIVPANSVHSLQPSIGAGTERLDNDSEIISVFFWLLFSGSFLIYDGIKQLRQLEAVVAAKIREWQVQELPAEASHLISLIRWPSFGLIFGGVVIVALAMSLKQSPYKRRPLICAVVSLVAYVAANACHWAINPLSWLIDRMDVWPLVVRFILLAGIIKSIRTAKNYETSHLAAGTPPAAGLNDLGGRA